MKRFKAPTCTHTVFRHLINADDFMTAQQIVASTTLNKNQVSASLHSLRHYKAVDCMDVDGVLWWFATPDTDARLRVVDERTPEAKPRKPRKYCAVSPRSTT